MQRIHNTRKTSSSSKIGPVGDRVRRLMFKSVSLLSIIAVLSFGSAAQPARNGSACHFISGFIHGQIIGNDADRCPIPGTTAGALTEIGTFTDADENVLGTFVACATSFRQNGDGTLMFGLAHTYTTNEGDTFTTTDNVVASPTALPVYSINNRAYITGGTGSLQDAFGTIHDHGTVDFGTFPSIVSVEYSGQICIPQ